MEYPIFTADKRGKMESGSRIGIIGGGFVGSAVAFGFGTSNAYDYSIKIFDIDKKLATATFEETINDSEFIFICLPTPPNEDMSINLDIIYKFFQDVTKITDDVDKLFIVKSTVIPGTCRKLSKKYGLNIVSNPEFLTAARAKWDFINASQVVIGSEDKESGERLKQLYQKRFGNIKYTMTDTVTAEMIKYSLNTFFTVKLSFLNELKQLSDVIGVDWEKLIEGFVCDSRVSNSHVVVGKKSPDGKLGWGGLCFLKDTNALIKFGDQRNVDLKTLKAAWEKNVEIRDGVLDELRKQIKGR